MKRRTMMLPVLMGLFLSLPVSAEGPDLREKKPLVPSTMKKHDVRPTGEVRETKTFAPVVADYLRQPLASQLVTINPDGTPQVTVMWFRYEDGALLFTTTTDRIKFRNQQKDTRAVFTVLDPTNMYKWVIVHGRLSIDSREPTVFYRELAEHYLTGEGLEAWRKRAGMDKRTVLKLTPTRIRTMGFAQ